MTTEELTRECNEYAEKQGFLLNPDEEIRETIIRGLLQREEKFGKKFCPCRRISGNKKEDKKIICPCFWHLQEIKENGRCLCGLFVKKKVN